MHTKIRVKVQHSIEIILYFYIELFENIKNEMIMLEFNLLLSLKMCFYILTSIYKMLIQLNFKWCFYLKEKYKIYYFLKYVSWNVDFAGE